MQSIKLDKKALLSVAGFATASVGLWYLLSKDEKKPDSVQQSESESVTRTLRVCVTGAAGQIGYAFLPLLANGDVFGPHVKIQLRLLDIPSAEKALQGVNMELQDGAYPLLEDVRCGSDPEEMFKDCNVVVFIGGFPRKKGMERKELLSINGQIFRTQGAALDKVAKKDVRCVVVANPANTNCLILQDSAPSIPKENFTALTRLDHNRAISQLASKSGLPISEIKNVIIWGNHSATQYPDVNHGNIMGKPIRKVINDDEYLNGEFISKVQKRGAEVIEYRGGSSVFSAANAIKDHLHDWYFGTQEGVIVSKAIVSDGSYGVPKGLVFSFPVRCKPHFNIEIVKDLEISGFSQEKINATTQELEEEKADAFGKEIDAPKQEESKPQENQSQDQNEGGEKKPEEEGNENQQQENANENNTN